MDDDALAAEFEKLTAAFELEVESDPYQIDDEDSFDPYQRDDEDSFELTSSTEDVECDMCSLQDALSVCTDVEGSTDDNGVLSDEYELVELSQSERADIENNHESYWKVERDIEIKAVSFTVHPSMNLSHDHKTLNNCTLIINSMHSVESCVCVWLNHPSSARVGHVIS